MAEDINSMLEQVELDMMEKADKFKKELTILIIVLTIFFLFIK